MTINPANSVVTTRSPIDLVTSVPFMIGYHPRESGVMVFLGRGVEGSRRVVGCARLDLDALERDPGALDIAIDRQWSAGASAVFVMAFSGERVRALDGAVAMAKRVKITSPLTVEDIAIVCDGRVWLDGEDLPGPGVALPVDSAVAVAFTVAGRAPLASREALAATYEGSPDHELAGLLDAAHAALKGPKSEAIDALDAGIKAWGAILDVDSDLRQVTPGAIAAAVLALEVPRVRDCVLMKVVGGLPSAAGVGDMREDGISAWVAERFPGGWPTTAKDREGWARVRMLCERMREIGSRIPDEYSGYFLGLLAFFLWARDDLMGSRLVVERLQAQPSPLPSLAESVQVALDMGVPFIPEHRSSPMS